MLYQESPQSIAEKVNPVLKRYGVRRAILFGSYGKGTATEKSDIDMVVDSGLRGLRFVGLRTDLEDALDNREVDLFDISHIVKDSTVEKEIKKTGVKIYG